LEIGTPVHDKLWSNLKNTLLPNLQILRAHKVPSNILANFIENNQRNLSEIKVSGITFEYNKKILTRAIYQTCPNLRYLELIINNDDILEIENLLINCKYLDGIILHLYEISDRERGWDKLFEILTKSSPKNLFKFKFIHRNTVKYSALKKFFNNWKDRNPMLLHFIEMFHLTVEHFNLIEKYKKEGVIKSFYYDKFGHSFNDFEWIKKK